MTKRLIKRASVVGLSACAVLGGGLVQADTSLAALSTQATATTASQQQQRAQNLLYKAVQHLHTKGPAAVNDFTYSPEFIDRDLYVYSLSASGQMLSSGGWSAGLIGQNVREETDDAGKPFFKQMLDQAQQASQGSIEYFWYNPNDGQEEVKLTYFEVVDGIVVAVGFFPGLSTEEQAQQKLELAVRTYTDNADLALRKFRNRQGEFRSPGQYVFVLDAAKNTVLLNPEFTEYNGRSIDEIADVRGQQFLRKIVEQASPDQVHTLDYWWLNPSSKQVEPKRAFFQQVDTDVIVVTTQVLADAPLNKKPK